MTMVFALGMSRPDSMMVVHSSTSISPSPKVRITEASMPSGIWP